MKWTFFSLLVGVALACSACEQHSVDETRGALDAEEGAAKREAASTEAAAKKDVTGGTHVEAVHAPEAAHAPAATTAPQAKPVEAPAQENAKFFNENK